MSEQRFLQRTLMSSSATRTLCWLLALAAVMIFIGMGLRSPWPPDEPRFANIAREMLASGQWLFPTRGGELYPDKPPLFMWAIAAFLHVTGNLNVAMLLPSALSSLITLAAVFDLGRRLWGLNVARNAALLLLFTPQFLIQAKFAQIDAMLSGFTTLACYGLLRHFFYQPDWRWYMAGWGFMGAGIITKGVGFLPIFLLPLIALYHYFVGVRADTYGKRAWLGPLALLAVISLWLAPMLWHVAREASPELIAYRDNILFKQTGERFANPWGHIKPWYYLWLSVVPLMWMPGSLLLFTKLDRLRLRCQQDPRILLLFTWVLLVVLFFSLSSGKRGVYILPALPFFCLALSATWSDTPLNFAGAAILRVLVAAMTLVAGAASVLAFMQHPALMSRLNESADAASVARAVGWVAFLICTALVAVQWFYRKHMAWTSYAAMVMVMTFAQALAINPLLEPMRTPEALMRSVAERIAGGELSIIDSKEQYLLFSPVDLVHFGYFTSDQTQYHNAWQWMSEAEHRFLMAPLSSSVECFDTEKSEDLGYAHRQHWMLFSRDSMLPQCPASATPQRFLSIAGQDQQRRP